MRYAIRLICALVSIAALAASLAAQRPDSGAALLRAATDKAVVDGDLNGAIEQYQAIVDRFKTDRAVVATALVQMAECHEKLGNGESRKIYERVVREFGDQKESAATARTRLASIAQSEGAIAGLRARGSLVWADASLFPGSAAISRDGRHIIYASGREQGLNRVSALHVRDLRVGLNRPLTVPDHTGDIAMAPVISPTGNVVAYGWYDGARTDLRFVTLDGSPPPIFHQNDLALAPFDWSSDGKHIAAFGRREVGSSAFVGIVSLTDSSVRVLKTIEGPYPSSISLSADGRYLVYDSSTKTGSSERDIFILRTDGGEVAPLVMRSADDRYPRFTPDGSAVVFVSARAGSDDAWLVRVVDGKAQGPPELVKSDVGTPIGITNNGSFYYTHAPEGVNLFAANFDPANGTIVGQPATVIQRASASFSVVGWSPNEAYLAYPANRSSSAGADDSIIVVRSVQTGEEHELAPGLAAFFGRGWSDDSRFLLAHGRDKQGRAGIYQIDARTGTVAPLFYRKPGEVFDHPNWFAKGKSVVFIRQISTGDHIAVRDLETSRETELYRPPPFLRFGPADHQRDLSCLEVSADHRQVAFFLRDEKARTMSLMITTAPGQARELGGFRWKYPERINAILAFTPDGRYLLFTTFDGQRTRLWRIHVEDGGLEEIRIQVDLLNTGRAAFHPDGRQLAFAGPSGKRSVWVIENVVPRISDRYR